MKITYVGNISKDEIINKENKKYISIGGSAIYSSFATRAINHKIDIEIIGNTSRKNIEIINKRNIYFYGKQNKNETKFFINEIENSCIGKNYNNISFKGYLNTEHLHISFRKGIDIDKILESKKISFNSLSVDVMIHSIEDVIPKLEKYEDIIDILFCNLSEYKVLKEKISKIPLIIITNNKYPIIIKSNNDIFVMNVKKCEHIVSDTGAGDSFIGGFLGEYIKNKNIYEAVRVGILTSNLSLSKIGPLEKDINNLNKKKDKILKLPSNIIIMGNSCVGKTTFVQEFNKYFDVYENIDDLDPLLEIFRLDDILRENKKLLFDKNIQKNIKFCKDILEQYKNEYPNINFYTSCSIDKKGHDIINPILWDKILEYSLKNNTSRNKIIEFARGKDQLYEKKYGKDCYRRSIEIICKYLTNIDDTLIINIKAPYENRLIRNESRRKKGGHYVSTETMNQVYKDEIFNINKKDEFSIINIKNKDMLVYDLYNQQVDEDKIIEYINNKIYKLIEEYNNLKGEK